MDDLAGWITNAGRRALSVARALQRAERYAITDDEDGYGYLWCAEHTANSDDYLAAWTGPTEQHAETIAAVRSQHETEHH